MTYNPVGWFEIYVQDMPRAKAFYEAVFQWKLTKLEAPGLEYWMFPMVAEGKGAAGALIKVPGVASGGSGTLVYFSCEDCAVEGARVEAAGGKVKRPKTSIGEFGFVVLAVDTEGNMIGLHSRK